MCSYGVCILFARLTAAAEARVTHMTGCCGYVLPAGAVTVAVMCWF